VLNVFVSNTVFAGVVRNLHLTQVILPQIISQVTLRVEKNGPYEAKAETFRTFTVQRASASAPEITETIRDVPHSCDGGGVLPP
jgi:hypothetical protein